MENVFEATYIKSVTESVALTSEQMRRIAGIMVETFVGEIDTIVRSTDEYMQDWPPEIRWALFNAVVHEMSKDEVWRRE